MLDETGVVKVFQIEGTFPMFGNHDRGVDQSATSLVGAVSTKVARPPIYTNERHTRSTLPITANVAYGKLPGATADGRQQREPLSLRVLASAAPPAARTSFC